MLTLIRCGLAAVLSLLACQALAAPPSEARLRDLMAWGAILLDVDSREVALPRILYTSQHNIMVEYYGPKAVADADAKPNVSLLEVRAIYQREARTMILNEAVDYTDPANEYTLVHELVHHLQAVYDLDEGIACPKEVEVGAYKAQNLWVMATGKGEPVDPLSLWLFTMCPTDSRH